MKETTTAAERDAAQTIDDPDAVKHLPFALTYGLATDANRAHREAQQDAATICQGELLHPTLGRVRYALTGVFDGMGGGTAGEIASSMAGTQIPAYITAQLPVTDLVQIPDILRESFWTVNRAIFARSPGIGRMGTTAAVALYLESTWEGRHLWVGHVGDSRVYAFTQTHEPSVTQVTIDHSYVQQLVRSGDLTEEEALLREDASLLTAALGAAPAPAAFDVAYLDLGDRPVSVVLLTDGVWGPLVRSHVQGDSDLPSFDTYLATVLSCRTAEQAAALLVQDAIRLGGDDNATCGVLAVQPNSPQPATGSNGPAGPSSKESENIHV